MLKAVLIAVLLVLGVASAAAQDATAELAAGDRAYATRNATEALRRYERAASLDTLSYEAAWKTARSAADLEITARNTGGHTTLLLQAERFARRAAALKPSDAEGHFALARALGLTARSVGVRQRVRYANDIRAHALECVRIAPRHSGCLHILGAWNAEVMRLSGVERFLARRVLGGRTFGEASWAEAVRYLEAAVAAEPARIAHRIELAEIYLSMGRSADARREYEAASRLDVRDFGDEGRREQARAAAARLN